MNQLEENVIQPLCQPNSNSRNMECTLNKPDEPTVQNSCSARVAFNVDKEDNQEYLDMTVNERSSDVILGLPHDVVVWTVILHLIRWEVKRRTPSGRHLLAGTLSFRFDAGSAHVYDINKDAWETLLSRSPKNPDIRPTLSIGWCEQDDRDLYDLAKSYPQAARDWPLREENYREADCHAKLATKQAL